MRPKNNTPMDLIGPQDPLAADITGRNVDQCGNAKAPQDGSRTRQIIAVTIIECDQGGIVGHDRVPTLPIAQV
jgi:hypothetical protein